MLIKKWISIKWLSRWTPPVLIAIPTMPTSYLAKPQQLIAAVQSFPMAYICWHCISAGLNFYQQQLFTCTFYSYGKFLLYGTWSCYKFPPAIQHKMEFHRKASRTYKHPATTNHIQHRTVLFHPPWPLKQQRDTFLNNWDSSSLLNLKNFVITWRISGEI